MMKYLSRTVHVPPPPAAKRSNVPLQDIMKTSGWKTGRAFAKYCEKQIITAEPVFTKSVQNDT